METESFLRVCDSFTTLAHSSTATLSREDIQGIVKETVKQELSAGFDKKLDEKLKENNVGLLASIASLIKKD